MGTVDFAAQRDRPRKLGLCVGIVLGPEGLVLGVTLGLTLGLVVRIELGTMVDGIAEGFMVDGPALNAIVLGATDGGTLIASKFFFETIREDEVKLKVGGFTGSTPTGIIGFGITIADTLVRNIPEMRMTWITATILSWLSIFLLSV